MVLLFCFFCLFLCSFVRSFPLVSFSFAPRRSLREISKSCFRFKSYSTGSNPYYSRAHLMATSLQRPLIFVPADIPYIHCYFHPSSTATKTLPSCQKLQVIQRLTNGEYATQRDPYCASLVSISVLLIYFDSYMLNKHL